VRDVSNIELERLARTINDLGQRMNVWVGLPNGHPLAGAVPNARCFHSFEEFDQALSEVSS
jgi:hypothetical protein